MSAVRIKFDTREFTKTLREYAALSKRDIPYICNKKALFVARGAIRETPAVSAEEIKEFIGRDGGRIIGQIINKQRAEKGEKGLYGKAMQAAVKVVRASRLRSRAFLRSGWIWSIRGLAPLVGMSAGGARGARTFGQAKGKAIPATPGFRVVSKIINMASAAWDRQEGADKVATPALERAFAKEQASTEQEIERKLKDSAHKVGIKTR